MKTDKELVDAFIEYYSQDHTREFKKYWEYKQTPQDDIYDLILNDPNRAAKVIHQISITTDNWYIQDQLVCGLIYDFEHHIGENYTERLKD